MFLFTPTPGTVASKEKILPYRLADTEKGNFSNACRISPVLPNQMVCMINQHVAPEYDRADYMNVDSLKCIRTRDAILQMFVKEP